MGTVYKKDGLFLVRSETDTHVGFNTRFTWALDVNDATVFYGEHGGRAEMLAEVTASAEALEATETRTVTITA